MVYLVVSRKLGGIKPFDAAFSPAYAGFKIMASAVLFETQPFDRIVRAELGGYTLDWVCCPQAFRVCGGQEVIKQGLRHDPFRIDI